MADRAAFLRETDLFGSLPDELLAAVAARSGVRPVVDGEVVFREGDAGDTLFLIAGGEVEIYRGADDAPVVLEVLKERDFFGELAVLCEEPRTASARARTDGELVFLKEKAVRVVIQQHPHVAFELIAALARRLKRMNDALVALASPSSSLPSLRVLEGPDAGRVFPVVLDRLLIGRAPSDGPRPVLGCHLADSAGDIARSHAEIVVRDGAFLLADRSGDRGTWLNGERITGAVELRDGDEVRVGSARLRFDLPSGRSAVQ